MLTFIFKQEGKRAASWVQDMLSASLSLEVCRGGGPFPGAHGLLPLLPVVSVWLFGERPGEPAWGSMADTSGFQSELWCLVVGILVSYDCLVNYHNLGGLKQHRFIFLQFWRLEAQNQFHRAQVYVDKAGPFSRLSGRILFWYFLVSGGCLHPGRLLILSLHCSDLLFLLSRDLLPSHKDPLIRTLVIISLGPPR